MHCTALAAAVPPRRPPQISATNLNLLKAWHARKGFSDCLPNGGVQWLPDFQGFCPGLYAVARLNCRLRRRGFPRLSELESFGLAASTPIVPQGYSICRINLAWAEFLYPDGCSDQSSDCATQSNLRKSSRLIPPHLRLVRFVPSGGLDLTPSAKLLPRKLHSESSRSRWGRNTQMRHFR